MRLARRAFEVAFLTDRWKVVLAWTATYSFLYNCFWPWLFWSSTVLTLWTDKQWPAPPILPWEQLGLMIPMLATVGTIELFKQRKGKDDEDG